MTFLVYKVVPHQYTVVDQYGKTYGSFITLDSAMSSAKLLTAEYERISEIL